jgi:hypothetical protein
MVKAAVEQARGMKVCLVSFSYWDANDGWGLRGKRRLALGVEGMLMEMEMNC